MYLGNRWITGPEFRVIHRVIHIIWRHITSYSVYHTQYAIHIMCIYGVPTVYQCVFSIFDQYHVYTHSRPLILHSVILRVHRVIGVCITRCNWSVYWRFYNVYFCVYTHHIFVCIFVILHRVFWVCIHSMFMCVFSCFYNVYFECVYTSYFCVYFWGFTTCILSVYTHHIKVYFCGFTRCNQSVYTHHIMVWHKKKLYMHHVIGMSLQRVYFL